MHRQSRRWQAIWGTQSRGREGCRVRGRWRLVAVHAGMGAQPPLPSALSCAGHALPLPCPQAHHEFQRYAVRADVDKYSRTAVAKAWDHLLSEGLVAFVDPRCDTSRLPVASALPRSSAAAAALPLLSRARPLRRLRGGLVPWAVLAGVCCSAPGLLAT